MGISNFGLLCNYLPIRLPFISSNSSCWDQTFKGGDFIQILAKILKGISDCKVSKLHWISAALGQLIPPRLLRKPQHDYLHLLLWAGLFFFFLLPLQKQANPSGKAAVAEVLSVAGETRCWRGHGGRTWAELCQRWGAVPARPSAHGCGLGPGTPGLCFPTLLSLMEPP